MLIPISHYRPTAQLNRTFITNVYKGFFLLFMKKSVHKRFYLFLTFIKYGEDGCDGDSGDGDAMRWGTRTKVMVGGLGSFTVPMQLSRVPP